MIALLRKDLPWMAVFAAAGLLVALGAVLVGEPVDLLLFDRSSVEATFWTAFGGGIGLGWFAGIFDELLGARELLRQRPLSSFRLLAGKCLAVASVLLVWQLALPLATLLGWAFGSAEGLPLGAGRWSEQQATLAAAWPVAFAMLFAANLPLHWLPRFVVGGAGVYVAMLLADGIGKQDGMHDSGTYLLVCLALAAVFALGTMFGSGEAVDRDRALASTASRSSRWLFVTAMVLAMAAATTEWEAIAVQRLHRVYPEPWQQGREVVLVSATGPDWTTQIVDAEHRRTDRQPTGGKSLAWTKRAPWLERGNEFEQPRWRGRVQTAGHAWFGAALHLLADGTLWRERIGPDRQRRFERVDVAGIERFSPRANLMEPGWQDRVALVVEPGQDRVWSMSAKAPELRELALPDADRVRRGILYHLAPGGGPAAEQAFRRQVAELTGDREQELRWAVVVEGERANYLLVGDALHPIDTRIEDGTFFTGVVDDPLEFVRTMPATDEHDEFTHAYAPRTEEERFAALQVQLIASLRPPVLQVLAHVLPADARPGWLFDGLVVGGRRTWLVLLQVAIAAGLAWFTRRYLRQLGAPTAVWTAQVALFGLPAFVVLVACESPWRLRPVEVPARPPLRIGATPVRSA